MAIGRRGECKLELRGSRKNLWKNYANDSGQKVSEDLGGGPVKLRTRLGETAGGFRHV